MTYLVTSADAGHIITFEVTPVGGDRNIAWNSGWQCRRPHHGYRAACHFSHLSKRWRKCLCQCAIHHHLVDCGSPTSFDVALSRNGGSSFSSIPGCTGLPLTARSCVWTPDGPATTAAVIRVTAHDANGANVADVSDAVFSVASPSITVTAPNTAVEWTIGTTRSITWNHNLGINTFVRVELSRNGGVSWEDLAASLETATASTGAFSWQVTGPTTTSAIVRVTWLAGSVTDVSNKAFDVVAPTITVTAPNTGVSWVVGSAHDIAWNHNLGIGTSVRIELSRDGGSSWAVLTPSTPNITSTAGSFSWVVNGPVTTAARVRVMWTGDSSVQDVTDVNFAVQSSIAVTAPNTAVTWAAGSTRTITWTHNYGVAYPFDIDVSTNGGVTWQSLASAIPAATATGGSYSATMPAIVTSNALVRVSPASHPGDGDFSNTPFTLDTPVLTVTAPKTNVNWKIGSSRNITWSHNLGTLESVRIELSRDGGITWTEIADGILNSGISSGSFSWIVTGPATSQARIRISWMRDALVGGSSNRKL